MFYFRKAIPKDLRPWFEGRHEVKISLQTSDLELARARYAELDAECRQKLILAKSASSHTAVTSSEALISDYYLLVGAEGESISAHLNAKRQWVAWRIISSWPAEELERLQLIDFFDSCREHDTACDLVLADLIAPSFRETLVDNTIRTKLDESFAGLVHIPFVHAVNEHKAWAEFEIETLEIVQKLDLNREEIGDQRLLQLTKADFLALASYRNPEWSEDAIRQLHPLADQILATKPGTIGCTKQIYGGIFGKLANPAPSPSVAASRTIAAPSSIGGGASGRPAAATSKKLSDALVAWGELRQTTGKKSYAEAKTKVDRFITLHGDLSLDRITETVLEKHFDLVARLPTSLTPAKLLIAAQDPERYITDREREDPHYSRPTSATLKKEYTLLSGMLRAAKKQRWISANPAAGIEIETTNSQQRSLRHPFTDDMLVRLFSSPLFVGCAGPRLYQRSQPGPYVYQDELYWFFLIAALSGGPRENEIGQLQLDQCIKTTFPSGPTRNAPVFGTNLLLRTKTRSSVRPIISHSFLIELGLWKRVEDRRRQGKSTLFDLEADAYGSFTKEISRSLNRYIDKAVTDDPRIVFHSHRHEWMDRATDAGVEERVIYSITGHVPSSAGGKYGRGASEARRAAAIESIPFDFIDRERLLTAARRAVPKPASDR